MHSLISHQIQERTKRLSESEKKLSEAREGVHRLLSQMQEQESLLKAFLDQKKTVLVRLNRQQDRFRAASQEWEVVSKELNHLFQSLEADRDTTVQYSPRRRSLAMPLEQGRLVREFGKYTHPKFGTVIFHKGVEIEAEQNAPVLAVLDGVVEFEGWVRGMGNVVILHHGSGFYSLHAHLFKSLQTQGASVKKGDTIGLVGDTGNSEKPSLYFEIRENGKAVDPTQYFTQVALKNLKDS
jgi:septal ring factor EnvC (AmiA/AmiB activator)